MLNSLTIKNFRCFRDLKIEPLSRVNLIAGKNNSGKTALLEALFLLFSEKQEVKSFASAFRSSQNIIDDSINFWQWLPYQKNLAEVAEIEAVGVHKLTVRLSSSSQNGSPPEWRMDYIKDDQSSGRIERTKEGIAGFSRKSQDNWPRVCLFSTHPASPNDEAERFNRLALKKGGKKRLIELLRVVEPRLEDLQYLKIGKDPLVYAELDMAESIPLTQLGQGFVRLLGFFSEMLVAEAKIVLIDEIENGIHHSVLKDLWLGVAEIARQEDLQVFTTTHSWECIQAAHSVFAASGAGDFRLHRLERVGKEIKAVTYNEESLAAALKFELEVR